MVFILLFQLGIYTYPNELIHVWKKLDSGCFILAFFEMFGVVYAIFKCYQSISRLVYGCQDWTITKVQFEKLDGGVTCVEITRLGNLT